VTTYETCVVFLLGYPGMGKRTTGSRLAELLDGVLVDNQLLYKPVIELFRWDGKAALPLDIWERVTPIRDTVLRTIEDLAPASNSYIFTNVLQADDPTAADHYDQIRSLAHRRGSLFLAVVLTCDIDVQVSRIDNPDRIALRKGSDPEGYRWHRLNTRLFEPPADQVFDIDTSETPAVINAQLILEELRRRGFAQPAV
jgi:hypothetical protein